MNPYPKLLLVPALLLTLSSAAASPWIDRPVSDEGVKACVAEINRQADYSAAVRVIHNVDVETRRPVGHELRIETLVLEAGTDETKRAYTTDCTVTPRHLPLRVQVREAN